MRFTDGRTSNLQAVETTRPYATYELTVKTQMGRGSTIPKGRINLPREAKVKTKDRVLVFAEGRQAEGAKRAGAEFVGGVEMVEAVRFFPFLSFQTSRSRVDMVC